MQLFSILKKEFVQNVLTLITGQSISQLILYLTVPILTRLFSEELFGSYLLFSSLIILIKPLVSLQYELSIILPNREKDSINLFAFVMIILFVLNLVFLVIIIVFNEFITNIFNLTNLSYFIYFIPLSAFFWGGISALEYWSNRTDFFKNISKGVIAKSSSMSISQVTTGLHINTIGLIPGMLFGQFVQFLVLLKLSLNTILKYKHHISIKRMVFLAKKYKEIPIFNTLINFTNTLSNELPILMITKYFGVSNAGVYGLAIKISRGPISIIQQSVSQVFFNKASKTFNTKNNLNEIIRKTTVYLFKVAFLVFIPLFIISFYLDFIFGENWEQAGLYVRILIPWLFVMFIASPLTSITVILKKQKKLLLYDITLLTCRFFALYFGYVIYNDIIFSLLFFSSIGVIFNIFILFYLLSISKIKNITY